LQRTSVRRVVTRGRQRKPGIERQLKDALHESFAKTRFTDDQAAAVVLNRAGNDLRSRSGVPVDQNDERQRCGLRAG
jgi:hypothetical protein